MHTFIYTRNGLACVVDDFFRTNEAECERKEGKRRITIWILIHRSGGVPSWDAVPLPFQIGELGEPFKAVELPVGVTRLWQREREGREISCIAGSRDYVTTYSAHYEELYRRALARVHAADKEP